MNLVNNDRVRYAPTLAALYGAGEGRVVRPINSVAPAEIASVAWDDGSISYGIHHTNLEKVNA